MNQIDKVRRQLFCHRILECDLNIGKLAELTGHIIVNSQRLFKRTQKSEFGKLNRFGNSNLFRHDF